jgi:hypothetical protein
VVSSTGCLSSSRTCTLAWFCQAHAPRAIDLILRTCVSRSMLLKLQSTEHLHLLADLKIGAHRIGVAARGQISGLQPAGRVLSRRARPISSRCGRRGRPCGGRFLMRWLSLLEQFGRSSSALPRDRRVARHGLPHPRGCSLLEEFAGPDS